MFSNVCKVPHVGNARLEVRSDSRARASASSGGAVRPRSVVDSIPPLPTASQPGILQPRPALPRQPRPVRGPRGAAPRQVGGAGAGGGPGRGCGRKP